MEDEGTPDAPIPVVAAVVERDGAFLVALRPARKRHGGLWEFPGGKVASDETDEEALRRELAEEIAVQVRSVGPPLYSSRDPGTRFSIRFRRVEIRGEPTAREHDEIRWVPPSDLPDLPLAPADRSFVVDFLAAEAGRSSG